LDEVANEGGVDYAEFVGGETFEAGAFPLGFGHDAAQAGENGFGGGGLAGGDESGEDKEAEQFHGGSDEADHGRARERGAE
jgi:hypothetical protein